MRALANSTHPFILARPRVDHSPTWRLPDSSSSSSFTNSIPSNSTMFKYLTATIALVALTANPLLLSPVQAYAPCNKDAGEFEMSVEGVPGVFCVTGSVCIATNGAGSCPPIQTRLPDGSYCGLVRTDVYGCKAGKAPTVTPTPTTAAPTSTPTPTTAAPTPTPTPTSTPVATTTAPVSTTAAPTSAPSTVSGSCPSGSSPISVEGVPGVFCAQSPICMGTETNMGSCPVPQPGLPDGSYCGKVASGVFGCKVGRAPTTTPTTTPAATPSVSPIVTPVATSTVAPATTSTTPTTTTSAPTSTAAAPSSGKCAAGQSEMSVEGVKGVFCVSGTACAANISNGTCPSAQTGLQYGSYCATVRTGVYGCKPYANVNQQTTVTYESPVDCSVSAFGKIPVSIVGATRAYCAAHPVCAGTIKGNCPSVQPGLLTNSICAVISTGVYGCVFPA